MSRQTLTFKQHTSRYGMIVLMGAFMIMTLPFLGMLNLWIPAWITIPIMLAAFGACVVYAARMAGKWIIWAAILAGAMGFGTALESYDERLRVVADELGPIAARDIAKHPDVPAFKLIEGSFEVGAVEGWHEVCGEDSCTEYVLLSLTFPGQTTEEPIGIWFEVALNDIFGPDYIFERDTSSGSQEDGVRRACADARVICEPSPMMLIPIAPETSELATPAAIEIFGIVAATAWFIPCFFGWLIGIFRRRSTKA